jgi:hypothetical protein
VFLRRPALVRVRVELAEAEVTVGDEHREHFMPAPQDAGAVKVEKVAESLVPYFINMTTYFRETCATRRRRR